VYKKVESEGHCEGLLCVGNRRMKNETCNCF
jgi:hypothetical protein